MLISDYPVVSVHIPPLLRPMAEGHEEIMASGETLGDLLEAIGHVYPALGESLFCADGSLADGLALYFGGVMLHGRECLDLVIGQEEILSIVATGNLKCDAGGFRQQEKSAAPANEDSLAVISVGE